MAARVKREDAPIAFGRRGLDPDPRHVPEEVWGQREAAGREVGSERPPDSASGRMLLG
jgi:hypothetical protein